MPDKEFSRRAYYMMVLQEALLALDGSAETQDVYRWLRETRKAKAEDLEKQLPTGGSRFEKEVRFARMMMARAGLLFQSSRGRWELTGAGRQTQLTPELSNDVLKALHGVKSGALNPELTYGAIVEAAKARRFVSYGHLAEASGVPWNKAHRPLPVLLGRLVLLAHVRGWPMLSAITVNKDELESGRLTGSSLSGFLSAAKSIGLDPGGDPDAFVRDQQARVFEWARSAPERMGVSGSRDEPEQEADELLADTSATDGLEEYAAVQAPSPVGRRRYWFGGATWEDADQTGRFLNEGVWQNGHEDQFSELVRQMAPGDRIAIKAAFVQKLRLPFDVAGAKVSAMRIKATGTVVENLGDGQTVRVAWDLPTPPRDWYFFTYLKTLHEADPEVEQARKLIEFTFAGEQQDYDWWLHRPYFARKYGRDLLPVESSLAAETPIGQTDAPVAPDYTVEDILTDGCFLSLEELVGMLVRLKTKMNLVLQGPPGTGKTWLAKRLGYVLLGTDDREAAALRMRVVQFHPSLAYEDFVRGWRPVDGRLELADGILLRAIDAALSEPDRPFVLVIEEVNRGNPAQIFGEMLTLLEDTKRKPEEALELAYPRKPGERVYIPDNLYVIGTMNVADRSLALVDLALRRRFAFVSLEPRLGEAWRKWARETGGLEDAVIDLVERRLGGLNDQIASDRSLGPQFRVGHSYVTPNQLVGDDGGIAWFRTVVETEIVPLLDEYWYDQPDKVTQARTSLLQDLP
jgi:5-methylcytosine-specific restriction protein B